MSKYKFTFCSLKKNRNDIIQPYLLLFKVINCLIILFFLLKAKKKYTFLLLFFILCFELFRTFSYFIHISDSTQISIMHMLSYFINFALILFFYNQVKKTPSFLFIMFYLFLIFVDLYVFLNMNKEYYILSQALLFFSLLLYYYPLLTKNIKNKINIIIFFVLLIIILLLNEEYNCKKIMSSYLDIPYYILFEITIIALFHIICSNFYKL